MSNLKVKSVIRKSIEYRTMGGTMSGTEGIYDPAIIVSVYKNKEWVEDKVCSAPMLIENPDKYDERAVLLLICQLSKNSYSVDEKSINLLNELVGILNDKFKMRKELEEKTKTIGQGIVSIGSDDKRREFYMGKGLILEKSQKPEDAPSLNPPKEWWERMRAKIKAQNPEYDDDTVDQTVGSIWYHKMSGKDRSKKRKEEGKSYGKAPVQKSVTMFGKPLTSYGNAVP